MHEVIKEGEFYGMQSFDQHLLKHLQAGRITFEEAHEGRLLAARLQAARPGRPAPASPRLDERRQPEADPAPAVVADIGAGAAAAAVPMASPPAAPVMAPAAPRRLGAPARLLRAARAPRGLDEVERLVAGVGDRLLAASGTTSVARARCRSAWRSGSPPPARAPQSASRRSAPASSAPDA